MSPVSEMVCPEGAPARTWRVGAALAECPGWLASAGLWSWIDILGPSYNLLDPVTGAHRVIPVHAKIGSAAPLGSDAAIVALEDGLWMWRDGRALEALPSPDMTGIHFNDGKCDAAGRFWVGARASDGSAAGGALYSFDMKDGVREADSGLDVPNGLGWSPDGRRFYLIDTIPRLLYEYDVDLATGSISRRRVLRRFDGSRGKPDGLAVDTQGRIWCAMWDGGGIQILSPQGDDVAWLETPCRRPTSCAFGGRDGRTLFVTTASYGLEPGSPDFGLAGSVMAYRVDAAGVPVALFAGK